MLIPNLTTRFFNWMFKQPGSVARCLMPFVTVGWALGLQVAVSQFIPPKVDFPYAFFYLFAILATAWFGGYVPGVVSVVVATIASPLIAPPDFHLTSIDPSRLVFSLGLSVLISLVAQSQRRMRDVLGQANTELDLANAELDDRALMATVELVKVVDDLRLEVAQYAHIEDELRQSGERVDMALDAAGIGVWGVNLATGELKRSRRHDAIFGYDASDSRAGLFDQVIPEDLAAVERSFQNAVEARGACEFECRIWHPQAGIRWIWAKGKAIVDETGEARSFLGSSRDITARKSAEEELNAQLERLNLLARITRSIAERQDLRGIFQVVVRSLEDGLPVDFACVCLFDLRAGDAVVTGISGEGEALAVDMAMTEQAHIKIDEDGLSKCVQGQLVYEKDLREVDSLFAQRLGRGGLCALVAAPLLVENHAFGALIAARREPNSFTSGDCEFLRQLSEHVALAAHRTKTHNALQQAHDGLPQARQTAMQHDLQALGQMTEATPPPLRILSVDDDPVLIKCLREALEADGHAVVTAHGGQDGIDAFRDAEKSGQPFEVVITDLGMPYVDGREVASAIKAGSPSTPVILLTGWGQGLAAEGDIPPQVDRVLNKPPRLWELRAALADLAGRSVTTSVAAHEGDAVATEQAS